MKKPIHFVKHVRRFSLPDQGTHVLELLIRQATCLRGKTGSVSIMARLFPYPRQGTIYFDFAIEIKKQYLSKEERKRIFSEAVDSAIKYERVGSLFAIEQASTEILVSFRGEVFTLWDGQQFRSL